MANDIRVRPNFVAGALSADMASGATSMSSAGLADLPAIGSTEHTAIEFFTRDATGRVTKKEIVWVTAHTAAATTATIVRGKEGTTAQNWVTNDRWAVSPIVSDAIVVCTSGTRPSQPYTGQVIYETDTDRPMVWDGAAWKQLGLKYDAPTCRVFNSADISIPDNTFTALTFNSERFDNDTMHSTSTNTGRITFNTAGVYVVSFTGLFQNANDYDEVFANIRLNGGSSIVTSTASNDTDTTSNPRLNATTIYKFAVNDYIEACVFQNNAANVSRNLSFENDDSPHFMAAWVSRG